MPLIQTGTLINEAQTAGAGIGAFNVLHLETAEALAEAAERSGRPVILQLSENCINYHGALRPIALATLAIAEASSARIAVHLDHAEDPELALSAIDLGFGSVMYDGATLEYAQNVAQTQQVVRAAHAAGVFVEAELGAIGGKGGAHTPGVRTDPAEAVQFVAETGVDALAVAVGSSHAMTERTASIDLDLVARLRDAVSVPLVLHGSSGVPDAVIADAIRAGLTKINVSTLLNTHFTGAVRRTLEADPKLVDSRKYLAAGREAIAATAAQLLEFFASVREVQGAGAGAGAGAGVPAGAGDLAGVDSVEVTGFGEDQGVTQ